MAKASPPPKSLTPGKAVLIGVLSVVLLGVIVTQFGGKKKVAPRRPRARRVASESADSTTSSAVPSSPTASKGTERPWPTFDVAEVVASNPFDLPEVLRPKGEDSGTLAAGLETGEAEATVTAIEEADVREMRRRQAEFMASLRAKGVDMILRSTRGSVARIGDLSLRVGDIHEGLKVDEIGESGVVFSPATAGKIEPE